MIDRVAITSDGKKYVDNWKDRKILGLNLKENIDSYLLGVALGINKKLPQSKKRQIGFIVFQSIHTEAQTLIKAALLGTANSDKEYEEYADFRLSAEYCDLCSEIGYMELQKVIDANNWDEDLIEAFYMKKLDQLYKQNVEALLNE